MASNKSQCFICNKNKIVYKCEGCSKEFCIDHLTEHRQTLSQELIGIENDCDQFQQKIREEKQNPENCRLIKQINEWEQNSILKIKQMAEECRENVIKSLNKYIKEIEKNFIRLSEQIEQFRQENEFNEIDLNDLTKKLTELNQPLNISIQEDLSSTFIKEISVISIDLIKTTSVFSIAEQIKWKQNAITIVEGNIQENQLKYPHGIFIDNDKTIYIVDWGNDRIVQLKVDENKGEVIAGGNGRGNRNDQLNCPTDILVDEKKNCLIIADFGNRRIIRWSTENETNQQILITDISCYGLTMNNNGFIYISDCEKHEVRRWKEGEISDGTIVAGGNGKGNCFNQFNYPTFIFVDENDSVYVSDRENNRVMKWIKDATEGIVVAGGNGKGDCLTQLSCPTEVIVDHLGQIYVADWGNDRVMRWREGSCEGSIVDCRNGKGNESNQLNCPSGLSLDIEGNLYVTDFANNRIQKFLINFD